MKTLTISNMYPSEKDPYYGTFVKSFYESLKFYEPDYSEKIVIKGRTKSKIKKIFRYLKFYTICLYKLLFCDYDIIYVHTITFPIPPIRIISRIKKLPLVFNVHGGDVLVHSKLSQKLKNIAANILPEAKLIVCPSEYFKHICLSEFNNIDPKKIFISPSGGVASIFFIEDSRPTNQILKIGYVSRIDPDKGWKVFVDAINILVKKNYDIEGILIGRGSDENKLRREIQNTVNIKYLGPKTHSELPFYYSSFDCFVFPSLAFESLGLVGIESMAAGTPVIASNIGGPSYYVIDNFNGFKFIPGNAKDLARAIEKFISLSEDDKIKLRENCRVTAAEYNSSKVSQELYEKIKSLC